jgi:putative phosphoribosyl transferase
MVDVAYRDREQAGEVLAAVVRDREPPPDLVLGLVRGGVPVAAQVAARLGVPMDVLVVRKLGVPWAPEVAFGAVGPGGVVVHNTYVEDRLQPAEMHAVVARETSELDRRLRRYRGDRPALKLDGRAVLIVDDGLATGATARAAVSVAWRLAARRVVVAVPVAARDAIDLIAAEADAVICPLVPDVFGAVSRFYRSFCQVTDDEVIALLGSG